MVISRLSYHPDTLNMETGFHLPLTVRLNHSPVELKQIYITEKWRDYPIDSANSTMISGMLSCSAKVSFLGFLN